MRNLILMLVMLLGSYSNAQNGIPNIQALGGGPNFRINTEDYRVVDTPFANELASIVNNTFDWDQVTWNFGLPLRSALIEPDVYPTLTGVRNGNEVTVSLTVTNVLETIYEIRDGFGDVATTIRRPGTITYNSYEEARDAAQLIATNDINLAIWRITSTETQLSITDTPHILDRLSLGSTASWDGNITPTSGSGVPDHYRAFYDAGWVPEAGHQTYGRDGYEASHDGGEVWYIRPPAPTPGATRIEIYFTSQQAAISWTNCRIDGQNPVIVPSTADGSYDNPITSVTGCN